MITTLSTYQKMINQGKTNWPTFLATRQNRLAKSNVSAINERMTENILIDLFSNVLEWELKEIQQQVKYADIILVRMSITYAIVEAKRPGLLYQNQIEIEKALAQVRRYADQQKVNTIVISDGHMLYAADIKNGGLTERLYLHLDTEEFPDALFWLSKQGIYQPRVDCQPKLASYNQTTVDSNDLLHPKYKIPARCFAYVGNANNYKTWKLPYRLLNGCVDTKRLSGAIRCIVTNYRGTNVKGIPDIAIPDVLKRLGEAAYKSGKMPSQNPKTAEAYKFLAKILENY